MTSPTAIVDGRRARRDRGMNQVLDAMIDLFTQGNLDPTPEQVAALAGVSGRTVYRYFEDSTALMHAAIDRHFERISPLTVIPQLGAGTLDERIARLVSARVRLFDAVASAYRAASAKAPTDPILADRLDFTRGAMREQVEMQFSNELDALDPSVRATRAAGIELLVAFESVDCLRSIRGLSSRATQAILTDALGALLGADS